MPLGMSDMSGLDLLDRLTRTSGRAGAVRERVEWARAAGGEVR